MVSTPDTHQDQLAKSPDSTLSSRVFSQEHTGGLSPGARRLFRVPVSVPPRKGVTLAASAEPGRNREDPWNKWFRQLLGTSPQIRPSGPASQEQQAPCNHPGPASWPPLYRGKPQGGGGRYRESAASPWALKNGNWSGRSGCPPLRMQKRARWVERKVCFTLEASNMGVMGL